jgi:hypothetical protein
MKTTENSLNMEKSLFLGKKISILLLKVDIEVALQIMNHLDHS